MNGTLKQASGAWGLNWPPRRHVPFSAWAHAFVMGPRPSFHWLGPAQPLTELPGPLVALVGPAPLNDPLGHFKVLGRCKSPFKYLAWGAFTSSFHGLGCNCILSPSGPPRFLGAWPGSGPPSVPLGPGG